MLFFESDDDDLCQYAEEDCSDTNVDVLPTLTDGSSSSWRRAHTDSLATNKHRASQVQLTVDSDGGGGLYTGAKSNGAPIPYHRPTSDDDVVEIAADPRAKNSAASAASFANCKRRKVITIVDEAGLHRQKATSTFGTATSSTPPPALFTVVRLPPPSNSVRISSGGDRRTPSVTTMTPPRLPTFAQFRQQAPIDPCIQTNYRPGQQIFRSAAFMRNENNPRQLPPAVKQPRLMPGGLRKKFQGVSQKIVSEVIRNPNFNILNQSALIHSIETTTNSTLDTTAETDTDNSSPPPTLSKELIGLPPPPLVRMPQTGHHAESEQLAQDPPYHDNDTPPLDAVTPLTAGPSKLVTPRRPGTVTVIKIASPPAVDDTGRRHSTAQGLTAVPANSDVTVSKSRKSASFGNPLDPPRYQPSSASNWTSPILSNYTTDASLKPSTQSMQPQKASPVASTVVNNKTSGRQRARKSIGHATAPDVPSTKRAPHPSKATPAPVSRKRKAASAAPPSAASNVLKTTRSPPPPTNTVSVAKARPALPDLVRESIVGSGCRFSFESGGGTSNDADSPCWRQLLNSRVDPALGGRKAVHYSPTLVAAWTPTDVSQFVLHLAYLGPRMAVRFREQMIDGEALLLLTMDDLVQQMGIRLGPAVKLFNTLLHIKHQKVYVAK